MALASETSSFARVRSAIRALGSAATIPALTRACSSRMPACVNGKRVER